MKELMVHTGRFVDPLNLTADDIDIEDIAHALAHTCRYGGHCSRFYSVAEHCVILSHLVAEEFAIYALLHDAYEAYSSDVPDPVKSKLTAYQQAENEGLAVILDKWGLVPYILPNIKKADKRLMLNESAELMPRPFTHKHLYPYNSDEIPPIIGLTPAEAKESFLNRFIALLG